MKEMRDLLKKLAVAGQLRMPMTRQQGDSLTEAIRDALTRGSVIRSKTGRTAVAFWQAARLSGF